MQQRRSQAHEVARQLGLDGKTPHQRGAYLRRPGIDPEVRRALVGQSGLSAVIIAKMRQVDTLQAELDLRREGHGQSVQPVDSL